VTGAGSRTRALLAALLLAVGIAAAGCSPIQPGDNSDGILAYEDTLSERGYEAFAYGR
jgi:hypothetical protein